MATQEDCVNVCVENGRKESSSSLMEWNLGLAVDVMFALFMKVTLARRVFRTARTATARTSLAVSAMCVQIGEDVRLRPVILTVFRIFQ